MIVSHYGLYSPSPPQIQHLLVEKNGRSYSASVGIQRAEFFVCCWTFFFAIAVTVPVERITHLLPASVVCVVEPFVCFCCPWHVAGGTFGRPRFPVLPRADRHARHNRATFFAAQLHVASGDRTEDVLCC